MQADAVLQQFMLLSGLGEEDAERWRSLCDAASSKILALLQPQTPLDDPRIALAAAGIAYCQYLLCAQGSAGQSIKLGEISVSSEKGGQSLQQAQALRDSFLESISEYLRPQGAGLLQVMECIQSH